MAPMSDTHIAGSPDATPLVSIPADTAANIAYELRAQAHAGQGGITAGYVDLRRWADMLDPPAPSLRDEVSSTIESAVHRVGLSSNDTADVVLAVVRRRIAGLDFHGGDGPLLRRDDVLRLLNGGSE